MRKRNRLKIPYIIKRLRHRRSLFQLVKKVLTNFFDCASPAKHFALGKMLLRSKSLEISRLFCGGLLYHEAGLAPSCSPAALLSILIL